MPAAGSSTPTLATDLDRWATLLQLEPGSVREVEVRADEQLRGMTSTLERVRVVLRDGGHRHLVVKRSAEAFRGMGLTLPQWRTERDFYRTVAPRVSLFTPRCWHAEASDDGASGMLVLDDLAPDRAHLDEPAAHEVRAVVDELATLERETRAFPGAAGVGTALPVHQYLFADRIRAVWDGLRPSVAQRDAAFAGLLDEIYAAYPRLLARIAHAEASVVHGDLAAANVIPASGPASEPLAGTAPPARIGIVDFGTVTVGLAAVDVSRIAAECAAIAPDADAHRALVEHWRDHAGGRRRAAEAWDEYRAGLALNAQFAMFLLLSPWPEGPRRDANLRSAQRLRAALDACEVPGFLRGLP